MNIQVLLFGIVSDLLETSTLEVTLHENSTIEEFKNTLFETHPKLSDFKSFSIAVNQEYATDDLILQPKDVIAIIPPVSGG